MVTATLTACGGTDTTSNADGSAGAAGAAGAPSQAQFEPPERGVQIATGPITLGPGEEATRCHFFDLPSDEALPIVKFEQNHSGFVHHFVMHTAGEDFEPGIGDCPTGFYITHPAVYPGNRVQAPFEMPAGVAFALDAKKPMLTQIHLLNTTGETVTEELKINLHAGDPATTFESVGIIGGADLNFEIPPRTDHVEVQTCQMFTDANVFALTSHSHARTDSFDIATIIDGVTTPVYSSKEWDSPDVVSFDPPIAIKPMDEFQFSCAWNNDTDDTVRYGDLASDEMCIFFGYYYPSGGGVAPCVGF